MFPTQIKPSHKAPLLGYIQEAGHRPAKMRTLPAQGIQQS
jgi:hypothetical protein